ncbi:MAG: acyl-CoA dehydratase activase [Candidatus Hodarchaeales archaeon]|jgi:predicted CoA-substrate-specific enzyme activase
MITCGLDIGAGTVKVALLEDGNKIIAKNFLKTSGKPQQSAETLVNSILKEQGLKRNDIDYLSTTGFSRYLYSERDLQLSDITTNARGAIFIFPNTVTILDVGTQSSRAISVLPKGKVKSFRFTEKCAAGAGRFIERCSKYLQIPMDEMSQIALDSEDPQMISSVCAVLAETEIINLIATEKKINDIVSGVFLSIADRTTTLLRRVGLKPELTLTGGLVKNLGFIQALENRTKMKVQTDPLGHYAGALGAAILSHRRIQVITAQN